MKGVKEPDCCQLSPAIGSCLTEAVCACNIVLRLLASGIRYHMTLKAFRLDICPVRETIGQMQEWSKERLQPAQTFGQMIFTCPPLAFPQPSGRPSTATSPHPAERHARQLSPRADTP